MYIMGNQSFFSVIGKKRLAFAATAGTIVALLLTIAFLAGLFKNRNKQVINERKFETFDDFIQRNSDGTFELKPERKKKLNTDVKRMREETEQYVLLAKEDGYYQCLHCARGTFYLYKGEIAKVGITRQGEEGRYDHNYYNRMKLEYKTEYRGTFQKAMEAEIIRIGSYPLTPENLVRPDQSENGVDRYKLARPILNTGDF